ncbi:hypothetical protein PpBr36_02043 [Pyricularia pennisetigena]|uniref:hypothetical protein n=1 Tax=Pyricularia pennisetigena TaxID=1578925 RepID=UPI0011529D2A|nr:hypothetical protein PpBr36_02043 [Pyricularia pennisetigena]TLS27825.1 hypothetical protein PpBr36_02043 [Pyricularia pennisetigena]
MTWTKCKKLQETTLFHGPADPFVHGHDVDSGADLPLEQVSHVREGHDALARLVQVLDVAGPRVVLVDLVEDQQGGPVDRDEVEAPGPGARVGRRGHGPREADEVGHEVVGGRPGPRDGRRAVDPDGELAPVADLFEVALRSPLGRQVAVGPGRRREPAHGPLLPAVVAGQGRDGGGRDVVERRLPRQAQADQLLGRFQVGRLEAAIRLGKGHVGAVVDDGVRLGEYARELLLGQPEARQRQVPAVRDDLGGAEQRDVVPDGKAVDLLDDAVAQQAREDRLAEEAGRPGQHHDLWVREEVLLDRNRPQRRRDGGFVFPVHVHVHRAAGLPRTQIRTAAARKLLDQGCHAAERAGVKELKERNRDFEGILDVGSQADEQHGAAADVEEIRRGCDLVLRRDLSGQDALPQLLQARLGATEALADGRLKLSVACFGRLGQWDRLESGPVKLARNIGGHLFQHDERGRLHVLRQGKLVDDVVETILGGGRTGRGKSNEVLVRGGGGRRLRDADDTIDDGSLGGVDHGSLDLLQVYPQTSQLHLRVVLDAALEQQAPVELTDAPRVAGPMQLRPALLVELGRGEAVVCKTSGVQLAVQISGYDAGSSYQHLPWHPGRDGLHAGGVHNVGGVVGQHLKSHVLAGLLGPAVDVADVGAEGDLRWTVAVHQTQSWLVDCAEGGFETIPDGLAAALYSLPSGFDQLLDVPVANPADELRGSRRSVGNSVVGNDGRDGHGVCSEMLWHNLKCPAG